VGFEYFDQLPPCGGAERSPGAERNGLATGCLGLVGPDPAEGLALRPLVVVLHVHECDLVVARDFDLGVGSAATAVVVEILLWDIELSCCC
jgi:hypothetical protein